MKGGGGGDWINRVTFFDFVVIGFIASGEPSHRDLRLPTTHSVFKPPHRSLEAVPRLVEQGLPLKVAEKMIGLT